ncbi:phosphoribosylanthranilate isomerase [Chitinophaga pendula]|uniref:phosphoribosylanthranilate isomerase n=1 Tax=Chitinophaga TaxID=79328 RepID=UPI000BAFD2AF|nr:MULTISPECIES: phosphoribosylanthranilate isomerase [Chitinophaga]ASZ11429.1 phosphoribosylanthranilate isomerase [Chitinophaga sp. MD30]UCJ05566.1 phosphoribosylanthranilate isomerase [Chitinophaga pendula]
MKIKVCGITRREDLRELIANKVDLAGFIFYEQSPRFAGNKLDARSVRELTGIQKVGVFVNAAKEQVLRTAADYQLDMVQLHGDESPEYCAAIREKIPVVKAFRVGANIDWDKEIAPYIPVTTYFLFDTASAKGYGGTGEQFDWSLLQHYPYQHPFFLSGGIGLEHTIALQQLDIPALYAVDVNSRFESSPGIKHIPQVAAFVKQIHATALK